MNHRKTVAELARLRPLLLLSRELLQSDDAIGSVELVGRALVELLGIDAGLLLVFVDGTENVVAFDEVGMPVHADAAHPLYRLARDCLAGEALSAASLTAHEPSAPAARAVLAAGVPPDAPIAALVAAWEQGLDRPALRHSEQLLCCIAELAVAALGKIQTRTELETLVWKQHEQIAGAEQAHATELAYRDKVEREMRALSLTDVLTGLRNRRGFFMQAEQSFRLAQRQHAKSAVIFADIDGLKHINDQLGHEAGDRMIRDAARIFHDSFRNADVVARLGGDEFVAFTLDDERPDAVLERIRQNLGEFNRMQVRPYELSFSTGIVECDPTGEAGLHDYLLRADQLMYAHKRQRLH